MDRPGIETGPPQWEGWKVKEPGLESHQVPQNSLFSTVSSLALEPTQWYNQSLNKGKATGA
jgi:hypothetical protein